ncbi:MAG: hypothetical protein KC776_11100 [Myxococcales bacterium]|nr:hypothetical protein [Myxococcales bacterium]MCB9583722.1 hypothetical protein [Polyangiaceae bacterium]
MAATVARRLPREAATPDTGLPVVRELDLTPDDSASDSIKAILSAEDAGDAEVRELRRVDPSAPLDVIGAHRLAALVPSERLGPFRVGARDVWFDAFFVRHARTVAQSGSSSPLLVLSKGGRPHTSGGSTTVSIGRGTVWIRGDLLNSSLPPGAYVGIRVDGGSLRIDLPVTLHGDEVEIGQPLSGDLRLDLAEDAVTPAAGGCRASGASIELPEAITLTFTGSGVTVSGGNGRASAWDQSFELQDPDGSWTFIEPLWTLVLGYRFSPAELRLDPVTDELVEFSGTANVVRGGLGFPVVVVSDPSILDEATRGAAWWFNLRGFSARWYEPEPRPHEITSAWLSIALRGTLILAEHVQALDPPVSHQYALWTVSEGGGRVPWTQSYPAAFLLVHRCDVVDGEQLIVGGHGRLAVDRPVQSTGKPVPAADGAAFILLERHESEVGAVLYMPRSDPHGLVQLALRNALVWTTPPAAIAIHGRRDGKASLASGAALLVLGAFGWAPFLPDPYVSNVAPLVPPHREGAPIGSLLLAHVVWTDPEHVSVAFAGALTGLSATQRKPGGEGPSQFPVDDDANIGLTQVAQHALHLSKAARAQWAKARSTEAEKRPKRVAAAQKANQQSLSLLGGMWQEIVGGSPGVFLLDVSTNQDQLGVAIGGSARIGATTHWAASVGGFLVRDLDVLTPMANMLLVTLPAVQWEPVRTLDSDQDILTLGWFPTPLASATDGGATAMGVRSQRLAPVFPDGALKGNYDAFGDGTSVGLRTTLPFGLVTVAIVSPTPSSSRPADLLQLTRPEFPAENVTGGRQVTAIAEGGRDAAGGVSPVFRGVMRQLINGVDLASGAPLGLSVLGSTADPGGSVETVFNNDMGANPRVPVTRFDISGYGASNFSAWQNPFAAFAEAAKVQFRLMVGRTALEIIKVNSVLHPWGIRVTRSVTIERRAGGGVIRRDSGWQPISSGMFDYRYADTSGNIVVAPYEFDAGLFRGLFNVRSIRPAPGAEVSADGATFIPYYFDADMALDGASGRTPAVGVLGYLQTQPNGQPASVDALRELIESQGAIGGPVDCWIDVAGSGLPFRVRRVEVGLADDGSGPTLVATLRGVPRLPKTGAWSVVKRPLAGTAPDEREAVSVGEGRGAPLVRRYPVAYPAGSDARFAEPPLTGSAGSYRFADAEDLFELSNPVTEYGLLQSTPTHAFLFPRPFLSAGVAKIESGGQPAFADVLARTTSKGAFPPPANTIDVPGSPHFEIASSGTLALSSQISIVGHPVPLRLSGSDGHGSKVLYDAATLRARIEHDRWEAELENLRLYHDIAGMQMLTGARWRVVGSTEQRSQIAELETLLLPSVEEIMRYIPLFGQRGVQGPIDLGATNAKHEFKVEAKIAVEIPPLSIPIAGTELKLKLISSGSTGFDKDTGEMTATGKLGVALDGKIPVLSIGVASVFVIVSAKVDFTIVSKTGTVTSEKLGLEAFAGIGIEGRIGPFKAYAYIGVGFILSYDITNDLAKYGGLVALEAGVEVIENFPITKVKIRAELKGLVYKDGGDTKCDYSGSVKLEVDLFLIISISVSYEYSDTTTL